MAFTTPPRPHDIVGLFPEIAAHARPAVRLHPREGGPSVRESSVGGPLLWPADEPWPLCELEHEDCNDEPLEYVRAARRHLAERDRREARGERPDWEAEHARLHELRLEHPSDEHPGYDELAPQPLVPLAQLYYRDVPGLPWGDRYDLLQVLWCPLDHPDADSPYCPVFQLRWRRAADVGEVLDEPPLPVMCNESYLPNRCAVHPEVVTEYPGRKELPEPLGTAVREWEERIGDATAYGWGTAQAPGWKVMGHGGVWGIIDPYPLVCECGARQLPLLTAASEEWGGGTGSWRPVESPDTAHANPVEVLIGRLYTLQLYYCPESEHHTGRTVMF